MQEFNNNFPCLRLVIGKMENSSFYSCDINKTLAEVRTKKGDGEISFSGRKKIGTIEREFEREFGLTVQICYTLGDGRRSYTSGEQDDKTLTQFNLDREKAGCQKNVWK